MKKVLFLALTISLVLASCKKKKAEKITIDLLGSWEFVTLTNGTLDPYDSSQPNENHSDVTLSYNDMCDDVVDYQKSTHLTSWVYTFIEDGNLIETKINSVSTLDNDAILTSACGVPVYKSFNDTIIVNKTWTLKGKELTITSNNSDYYYEVDEITASKMLLSTTNATLKGDDRQVDKFKKK